MKKKKMCKLKSRYKIQCMEAKYYIKNAFRKCLCRVAKIFKKMQLPMIILLTLIVIGLIVSFLIFPHWAHTGEERIRAFYYKLEFLGVLLTAISLIAAAITIIIALQKPKLKICFYTDHGSSLDVKKGELELGMDKDGNVGYQACVPTKWNMNLINVGSKTAEKIKIKVSLDNIYFDMSLVEQGYDLEEFQYGCGIFNVVSFEVTNLLRQGEQIVLPELPFYSSVCDSEVLRKQGYTYLKIRIYSGNHEPIVSRYKVIIRDFDLDSFGYKKTNEDSMRSLEYGNNFYNWYIETYNITDPSNDVYYRYPSEVNPYQIDIYPQIEEGRYLYQYYKDRDIDKMLFWGRIYYRAIGLQLQEAEALLQTELLKISVEGTMKKQGIMSII